MGLFECLLFFYVGGAASILKKYSLQGNLPCHLAWIGAGLLPVIFWITGGFSSPKTIFLFWTIWLPVLLYCASDHFKVNAGIQRIIETLGNMTYSSYLIHLPVQLIMAIICFRWKIYLPVFNPLFLTGYLCFIFLLSYFVYRYFERPGSQVRTALNPVMSCFSPSVS
jgi:peptidoglycan/LPS O-acetylase OafA/YrhL